MESRHGNVLTYSGEELEGQWRGDLEKYEIFFFPHKVRPALGGGSKEKLEQESAQ